MSSDFDKLCDEFTKVFVDKVMKKMQEKLAANPTHTNSEQKTYSADDFLAMVQDQTEKSNSNIVPDTFQSPVFSYKDRAEESKLKKIGYSVSKSSTLSEKERQSLLQNAIEHGLVSKGYVITYLENQIRINGKKDANSVALYKWKRDLDFIKKL